MKIPAGPLTGLSPIIGDTATTYEFLSASRTPFADNMGPMEVTGLEGPITTISASSIDSIIPGAGSIVVYLISRTSGSLFCPMRNSWNSSFPEGVTMSIWGSWLVMGIIWDVIPSFFLCISIALSREYFFKSRVFWILIARS